MRVGIKLGERLGFMCDRAVGKWHRSLNSLKWRHRDAQCETEFSLQGCEQSQKACALYGEYNVTTFPQS